MWSNEWYAKDLQLFTSELLYTANSLISIRQKHKIADKITSVNRALAPDYIQVLLPMWLLNPHFLLVV
jgi:hypothetical protein